MAKQTIEIDVPDGHELVITTFNNIYGDPSTTLIFYKKKETEFIEVRDYLSMSKLGYGVRVGVVQRNIESIEEIETDKDFIKWIDKDWRKVEI